MNDLKFYVFCLPRRSERSYWRAFLWPVKKLAVMLGVMPKTTGGKKWLKRIVFGGLVKMPVEIGPRITRITQSEQKEENNPQISQINADLKGEKNDPRISRISRNKIKEEDENDLYRGHYMEPDRISERKPDKMHKVIYCVASLDR